MKFVGKNTLLINRTLLKRAVEMWLNENRINNILRVEKLSVTPDGAKITFRPVETPPPRNK